MGHHLFKNIHAKLYNFFVYIICTPFHLHLYSPSPASIGKMHTLTEEAESATYEGAAGECPGSIRKYAMLAQLKSEEDR